MDSTENNVISKSDDHSHCETEQDVESNVETAIVPASSQAIVPSSDQSLSHVEAMSQVQAVMAHLITEDPLLSDLPPQVTLEEVNSCVALEYGQAIVVNVRRADDEVMAVVVTQNATVLDLKHAIKRYITLRQMRNGGKLHISWRYIWKRYWLYFNSQKLSDDRKTLKQYEIRNKDEVTFMKRLKDHG
ncbi:U11/U12 small nuclear ribonucleoprotein 25 kDa protein-like [Mizuhopecten yessoensis]|uniref:U11/U12 small nuclear ribonucleoprotein 25 kDa protein-like n=1 Tax=Mizuhopecten yessoensis TaxID=6573 RepID=UPI000B45C038|nr:U11/U12 small nuclear ribonucleoprotein 25 kDa protein-like [Mizuhopecten yessoensis]XP_021364317.1 U11/U12 small nuclear ribonucleoprotein 25 kDa protein-like [Mizuhopecten yessoensis]XP_021364319.1 U11/U12 small nuclear ribonucleoprotein 25 kDa protein-like [Mizuhopecten yessoensis]XP_021364320.1 U11/U12 small nuclear ribonucleoprotein 25 kDa protein-like [Mizuhopecten yessoensis]